MSADDPAQAGRTPPEAAEAASNLMVGDHVGAVASIQATGSPDEANDDAAAPDDADVRFRQMADLFPQIVWITDAHGQVEFFNRPWYDYTGVSRGQTTTVEAAVGYIHPDDEAATVGAFEEARRTGGRFAAEHRIRSAAGAYRWFLARAEPQRDARTGAITRWVGTSTDIHDRRLAEEALRASEATYRTLFGSIDEGFALYELIFDDERRPVDLRILEVNPAYERLTGRRDAAGRTMSAIVPGMAADWIRTVAEVAEGGGPARFERQAADSDRWFDIHVSRVEGGDEPRVVVVFSETTDRRKADKRLRASEERLQLALGATGLGVFEWDLTTDTATADHRLREVFGLGPDDPVVGRTFLDAKIHPDSRAAVDAALQAASDPAAVGRYAVDYRAFRADGTEIWVESHGQIRFEGEGVERRPVRVYGSVLDITGRRVAEDAVRASEERFRTLIQRSSDGVQLVTADGTILYSSDSVETVLGYRPDEIAGASIIPYIHPDDLPEVGAWVAEVATAPGAVRSRQYRVLHRDGSWTWVETTLANHLETPNVRALVGNFRNVTARRRIEAEREAFIDAAAHDLRTPLSTLRAQAQLMLRRSRRGQAIDPETLAAGLSAIDRAVVRMVGLIDEMMDAANLRADRALDLRTTPTDLVALARTAADEAQRGTSRHVVRMTSEAPGLVGTWDGGRLTRVLGNLLGNAVKYSPEGGPIDVRLAREEGDGGRWAVLTVSDRGLGIPAADLPNLFERFHRGRNVTDRIAGTGIGLAGAKQIVEQHGGTISAASTEGDGAVFTVRLPLPRQA